MHEIGHALGFYHTRENRDVMTPGGDPNTEDFSPTEQHHTQFAYTQERRATYAEITLNTFGLRRPRWERSPWAHGGLAIDYSEIPSFYHVNQ